MTRSLSDDTHELLSALQNRAEAVSAHYLSNGYREGQYWRCGDARNTPGQSLFLRLRGPSDKIGRWSDAATGEYGDFFNLIGISTGLTSFADIVHEARSFLNMPMPKSTPRQLKDRMQRKLPNRTAGATTMAAARLFAMARPISGTLVMRYLAERGIVPGSPLPSLRFHPQCYYRDDPHSSSEAWPALIAAATDETGQLHAIQRTWLDPSGKGKAPVATPRKSLGSIIGHAVRFGEAGSVMMAGEGVESVLSAHSIIPNMPMMAAGSAGHLGALLLPDALRRLYILTDRDEAGLTGVHRLRQRAEAAGIEAFKLMPRLGDFNEDLISFGANALRVHLCDMLIDADRARFMDR